MIQNCLHEPKAVIGGFRLSVCRMCRNKNIEAFGRMTAKERHPARGRRRPIYLVRDLREPTMEDLT